MGRKGDRLVLGGRVKVRQAGQFKNTERMVVGAHPLSLPAQNTHPINQLLFSLKNYLPCWDLNLGPPEYQAKRYQLAIQAWILLSCNHYYSSYLSSNQLSGNAQKTC